MELDTSQPRKASAAIKLTAALLVLPALYVAVSLVITPKSVQANSAPQAVPTGNQIADLEATARKAPTATNRINLALAYISAGTSDRALPVLLSVVAEDKNDSIAWNDLCVANTMQKAYAPAIEDCNTAIRLEPNFTLARNNLKWAQDEQRKAIAGGTPPPAAVTQDAAFYLNDGLKQANLGFYDEALESWRHALALEPSNPIAMNNIGTAYMMKKQTDEALVWFNKALAADPTMQLAKNNIAWAHQEQARR